MDGVYIDEIQPIPDVNEKTGGGYEDIQGKRHPTYEYNDTRDFFKMLRKEITSHTNTPRIMAHNSGTNTLHTLSHCDLLLTGEQLNSGYFGKYPEFIPKMNEREYYYASALPMDRVRAEFYAKQWGVPIAFLPNLKNQKDLLNNPKSTRDMLSRIMHADVIVWPLWCKRDIVEKLWEIREKFGVGDSRVTFTPYWENKKIVSTHKDARISYYSLEEKKLLIISNIGEKAAGIRVPLRDFGKQFTEEESGKRISLNNKGEIVLSIPRNDYKIITIE
jgi:hypothetical protein